MKIKGLIIVTLAFYAVASAQQPTTQPTISVYTAIRNIEARHPVFSMLPVQVVIAPGVNTPSTADLSSALGVMSIQLHADYSFTGYLGLERPPHLVADQSQQIQLGIYSAVPTSEIFEKA